MRDAGLRIAGEHRALDRRRAAPARQQRCVNVDAAEPRSLQHRLRQDQSIGDDDHEIRPTLRQRSTAARIAQGRRLLDRQADAAARIA